MSGIVAYVGCGLTHRAVDTVREISSRLDHRGPDDHGILVWSPPGEASFIEDSRGHRSSLPAQRPDSIPWTAVLAARRLSISDLSEAGHQPMLDAKRSCAVVLDGAIYNRSELRSELTAQGHRFRSRSDTEVLLEAYLEWGADCVSRLVGMFAFVVLDMPRRRVLIARDRFGLKPLFETTLDDGWLFASEVGALLESTRVSRRANPQKVVDYLATGLTGDSPDTMFAAIRQLPPASFVEWSPLSDDRSPTRNWKVDLSRTLDISFEEATSLVREEFIRSIEMHLPGNGPVGVMLSGGIDSSSIAAAMREVAGASLEIHTFSYIGEHGATSEESWIDTVNSAIQGIPYKMRMKPAEWASHERRSYHQGEPAGSLAIFAQGRLYEMAAAAGVRVVLSGQGCFAFGGYGRCRLARLTAMLATGRFPAADLARPRGPQRRRARR